MSDFEAKASGIFSKFADKLASLDLKKAASVTAVVGVAVFLGGVAQEMNGHLHLLQTGGTGAVDAYKDAIQAANLGIGSWVKNGIMGHLPSFGGDMQARGLVAATAGPAFTSASVGLARGFTKIRETLANAGHKLTAIATGQAQAPNDVAPAVDVPKRVSERDLGASLAKAKLALTGAEKTFVEPDYEKGQYAGRVLGETPHHLLVSVDGRANTATALEKSRLGGVPLTHQMVRVQFRGGEAVSNSNVKSKSKSM